LNTPFEKGNKSEKVKVEKNAKNCLGQFSAIVCVEVISFV